MPARALTEPQWQALAEVAAGRVKPTSGSTYTVVRIDVLERLRRKGLIAFLYGDRPSLTDAGRRALAEHQAKGASK